MPEQKDSSSPYNRFFLVFLPLFAILAGIGVTLFFKELDTRLLIFQSNAIEHVNLQREIITEELSHVESDLLFLSDQLEASGILENGGMKQRDRLANEWLSFSRRKAIYDQVRYLDENGMEIIRVNFNNGTPSIIPDRELQDKRDRYYFKDTISLKKGEIFVSPFDLNIEAGKIEIPFKPMLRFSTPVFDGRGKVRGIFLLNYLGKEIIDDVVKGSTSPAEPMLVNSGGYWLHAKNRDDEWGFMFGNNRTFGHSFPDAWDKISRAESGQFDAQEGIFTFMTIYPLSKDMVSDAASSLSPAPGQYSWKIISFLPREAVASEKRSVVRKYLMIGGISLSIFIISSWFMIRSDVKRRLIHDELIAKKQELERANLQLIASVEELKSIERLKNEFIQTITHELRSPLSPIIAYLEMWRGGDMGELSDVQREVLKEMHICGKNMQMVIDQLLDVANIQAGKIYLEPSAIDLNQLLTGAVEYIKEYAEERQIEVDLVLPPGPVYITGDRNKLSKVFVHLLRNAVKFNNDRGRVSVEAVSRDNVFTIAITDTGIGIHQDQIQRIFEGFYQVDSSATRHFWGVGLGLYLVKRLVELHNGSVSVESEPGKGSRFTVLIPEKNINTISKSTEEQKV